MRTWSDAMWLKSVDDTRQRDLPSDCRLAITLTVSGDTTTCTGGGKGDSGRALEDRG
jgi:hypothetical protein